MEYRRNWFLGRCSLHRSPTIHTGNCAGRSIFTDEVQFFDPGVVGGKTSEPVLGGSAYSRRTSDSFSPQCYNLSARQALTQE